MNKPNFMVTTGDPKPLRDMPADRRFFAVDPLSATNAQLHAEHLRAHHDFIAARQRESGVRARLCTTGCYSLYNSDGQFIGRTVSAVADTPAQSWLKTTAARMAYSEELAHACRRADQDFETSGTVSPQTIAAIRQLLSIISAP